MNYTKIILITGGAGFIGSHLVRHFVNKYPNYLIINFDALTYAGNLDNLNDIVSDNYKFFHGDIRYMDDINKVFRKYNITDVIHLAAESHVDNSIKNPKLFVETNVIGTLNLLNVARDFWKEDYSKHRFHHVSTDEVFGALNIVDDKFSETTPYNPHSPYSASKASSDHFVRAYHDTYGLNVTISNCSNNYGSHQHPEKLIPLVISKLKAGEKIPVYGTGENIRDWLYVKDHCEAIDIIFHNAKSGETYCIGGNNEMSNIDLIDTIINEYAHYITDIETGDGSDSWGNGYYTYKELRHLITHVTDRAGHDLRYAIDASKLKNELGWEPKYKFTDAIKETIAWYTEHFV